MAFNQYADPKDNFGEDLFQIFGPKANRRLITELSAQEKDAILEKVPEYVDTDDLGPRPSFYQITNKVLLVLKNTKALIGIDLLWCNSLQFSNRAMRRHASHYISTKFCYKNNSVQRGIWLRHLLRDILFSFDPNSVLMGLSRKLSDDTQNLNNGQHRTVACIIIGIREIPLEWQESDFESVDVDQYATDNLHTLNASPFDEYRIKVRRNQIRKSEGRTDLITDDIKCENIYNIHSRYGSRFVEKGKGSENVGPKECTGVGNMLKYYDTYGSDIYERTVSICCSVFSKAPLASGNAWGIMEFLREQDNNALFDDKKELDWTIEQALITTYSNPAKSGMHLDIKKAFKDFLENNSNGHKFLECPEPRIIAAGIGKICKTHFPDMKWAPVLYRQQSIEEGLKKFKIMP